MAINNYTILALTAVRENLTAPRDGRMRNCLSTGAHDWVVSPWFAERYDLGGISASDISDHRSLPPHSSERHASDKALIGRYFRALGYDEYVEIDIDPRGDILHDLDKPVPRELEQSFDLVINFSAHYAMNAPTAWLNVMRLLKVGGKVVTMAILGDMTGRFYLNPSPEFIDDFHRGNGCEIERSVVVDARGRTAPYEPWATKIAFEGSLIPGRQLPGYYLSTALRDYLRRRGLNHTKDGWIWKRFTRRFLGRAMRLLPPPNRQVWFVFRKVEHVEEPRFRIIHTYRDFEWDEEARTSSAPGRSSTGEY